MGLEHSWIIDRMLLAGGSALDLSILVLSCSEQYVVSSALLVPYAMCTMRFKITCRPLPYFPLLITSPARAEDVIAT